MDDSSRFVSGTPSLSQVKTLSHHINVTVTWPLPVDYHPDLHRYRLEYGTGRHSVPILKEDSVKLGEKDIYVVCLCDELCVSCLFSCLVV